MTFFWSLVYFFFTSFSFFLHALWLKRVCICLKKIDLVTVSFEWSEWILRWKKNINKTSWNASFGIALITFDVRRTCLNVVIGVVWCVLLKVRKKERKINTHTIRVRPIQRNINIGSTTRKSLSINVGKEIGRKVNNALMKHSTPEMHRTQHKTLQ